MPTEVFAVVLCVCQFRFMKLGPALYENRGGSKSDASEQRTTPVVELTTSTDPPFRIVVPKQDQLVARQIGDTGTWEPAETAWVSERLRAACAGDLRRVACYYRVSYSSVRPRAAQRGALWWTLERCSAGTRCWQVRLVAASARRMCTA